MPSACTTDEMEKWWSCINAMMMTMMIVIICTTSIHEHINHIIIIIIIRSTHESPFHLENACASWLLLRHIHIICRSDTNDLYVHISPRMINPPKLQFTIRIRAWQPIDHSSVLNINKCNPSFDGHCVLASLVVIRTTTTTVAIYITSCTSPLHSSIAHADICLYECILICTFRSGCGAEALAGISVGGIVDDFTHSM